MSWKPSTFHWNDQTLSLSSTQVTSLDQFHWKTFGYLSCKCTTCCMSDCRSLIPTIWKFAITFIVLPSLVFSTMSNVTLTFLSMIFFQKMNLMFLLSIFLGATQHYLTDIILYNSNWTNVLWLKPFDCISCNNEHLLNKSQEYFLQSGNKSDLRIS